jgi:outer membrane lipoprotein carrier protein
MPALLKKMIFKSCLLGLLSLIVVAAPQAQTPSVQKATIDAVTQFKSFLVDVKNAEGDFSQQQIRPAKQGETQAKVLRKSQGYFVFQRPGQFIWETKKPFEQKIIADGNQLLLWDKDLNQLTSRPAGQGLAASPAAILFGNTVVDEHFELIPGEDKAGVQWLELRPKSTEKRDIPYSRIGVGMKDGLPVGLELHDNFGTVILINLSKIKTNIKLAPQTFKFSPPTGAEVFKVK